MLKTAPGVPAGRGRQATGGRFKDACVAPYRCLCACLDFIPAVLGLHGWMYRKDLDLIELL